MKQMRRGEHVSVKDMQHFLPKALAPLISVTGNGRTAPMAQLKKILLVDDDEDLREALSEQLVMTEDFDVFEAGSGAQAMSRAKEALYDLVILDVGLPDTDVR